MSHRVVLSPEARLDVLEIEAYLLGAGPEIVLHFRRVLAATLRRVRVDPRQFPLIWRDVRRAQTRPFKYGVFFLAEDDCCRVFAIIDLRRHPARWRRRR